jgi:flavin-dependent dehydrogenase
MTSPDDQVLDVRLQTKDGYCYGRTIPRRLLDAQLAQAAADAGARLLEGTHVQNVALANGHKPRVIASGLEIDADMVILTDGSHAPITRRLGLASEPPEIVAVRQYFAGDAGPPGRMEIHFRPQVLPGYAWLFPIGNEHANVGTGTSIRQARRSKLSLRKTMASFLADPLVARDRLAQAKPVGRLRGHPLRTQLGHTRTHTAHVLVAGDAAGLVNPLSGEGITPAMESGELAATHALTALETGDFSARALAAYSQDLIARYTADQRASRILRRILSTPRLLNRVFRRLREDDKLALLITHIIIGHKSPRQALRPAVLLRLLA